MKIINKPKIADYSGKPYTKITWTADFKRFGIENYSEDMINLMMRRVYDIAGITDKKRKMENQYICSRCIGIFK